MPNMIPWMAAVEVYQVEYHTVEVPAWPWVLALATAAVVVLALILLVVRFLRQRGR